MNSKGLLLLLLVLSAAMEVSCTAPVECNDAKVDLVFVLDSSTSVTEVNFILMKDFVKDLLTNANIDGGNFRVGVITYSTEAYLQFNLKEHSSQIDLFHAINHIPYRSGSTNTADALKTMRTVMFTPDNGDRSDIPNVAIVITDGVSNINATQTIPEAESARAQGIHIDAIGVGLTDFTELNGMASKPVLENTFNVPEFSELRNLGTEVLTALCESASRGTEGVQVEKRETQIPDSGVHMVRRRESCPRCERSN